MKINWFIICLTLSLTTNLTAQNLVTFIPPDPNKGGAIPANAKIDTIYTLIDAGKNYRKIQLVQNAITVTEGYLIGNNKTGKWFNYAPNGILINVVEYENNIKSGLYLEFDNSGAVAVQENYLNGKLNGEQKKYGVGPGGRMVKSIYNFKEGVFDGTCTEYAETGMMRSQMQYKAGKKDGTAKWYFSNGKLAMYQTYQNDMLNGPQEVYSQDGKLMSEGDYLNNLKSGVWTEYHENGIVKSKGNYDKDVKAGTWNYYDNTGKQINTENF